MIESENNLITSTVDQYQQQIKVGKSQLQSLQHQKKQLDRLISAAHESVAENKLSHDRLSQLEMELEERLASTCSRYTVHPTILLPALICRMDPYFSARLNEANYDTKESEKVKRMKAAVASMKRIFGNVFGTLSELCRPIDQKYSLAVEILLAKNLDAIVVQDSKTALDCIQVNQISKFAHSVNRFAPAQYFLHACST